MKNSTIISVIIGVLVVGGLGYVSLRNTQSGEVISGEYKTHIATDYSFRYPENWFIHDNSSNMNTPYLSISNYDPAALVGNIKPIKDHFGLEIVKLPNPDNLELSAWITDFMQNSESQPKLISSSDIEVSGINAVLQIELVRTFQHPAVYFIRGNSVYIFNVGVLTEEFEPVFKEFLRSFKFL